MSSFQLPADFFEVFVTQVESATQSVYIQSLTLEVGRVMDTLEPALIRAARRGVKVELHIDWLAKDYVHGKVALTPRLKPSQRRYAAELHLANRQMIHRLKEAGVTVTFVNKPDWLAKILAIAGRNHIKMYMVDEKVVWVGGVNILDLSVEHADFMVAYTDQVLIQALKRVFQAAKIKDEVVPFATNASLLVDGGRRGQSVIYQRALELINQAEQSVVFMSQFVPEGALLKALVKRAQAGCQITVLTSPKSLMQFSQWPYRITYLQCRRALKAVDNRVIHLPQKVHSKLLIVDDHQALFGSHNLVETGINLGTAEIAVNTSEPGLLTRLRSFVHAFHPVHRVLE